MEKKLLDKTVELFIEPRFWWFRHLLFWCYWYNRTIFALLGIWGARLLPWEILIGIFWAADLTLVYLNYFVLAPKLLMRRRILPYALCILVLAVLYGLYTQLLNPDSCEDCNHDELMYDIYFHGFVAGLELITLTTGPRLILEYFHTRTRLKETQNESLRSELAYLKSQINPHFLFNTLNNIAVLSEKYPERVADTVVQLSKILRYQLYESEKDLVPLERDIENLQNFLDLEAIRLFKVDASIEVEGQPQGLRVSPLLFLPFLENAVKHSADPRNASFIKIRFKIEGCRVVFTAENSKPPLAPNAVVGGIGLKNLFRRLELLYPKRHALHIEDRPDGFTAILELDLEK